MAARGAIRTQRRRQRLGLRPRPGAELRRQRRAAVPIGRQRRHAVAPRRLGPHQPAPGGLLRRVDRQQPPRRQRRRLRPLRPAEQRRRHRRRARLQRPPPLRQPGVEGRVQPIQVGQQLGAQQVEGFRPRRIGPRHLQRIHPDLPGRQRQRIPPRLQQRRPGLRKGHLQLMQGLAQRQPLLLQAPPGPQQGAELRPRHRLAPGQAQHRQQGACLPPARQHRGARQAPGLHPSQQHQPQQRARWRRHFGVRDRRARQEGTGHGRKPSRISPIPKQSVAGPGRRRRPRWR